jgi:tetratricopeptide (TPR) repeat protein
MRLNLLLLACALAGAQPPDPAYDPLNRAYEALRNKNYAQAIANFSRAVELAPSRAAIRKDLAYTHLKVGDSDSAREQFEEAMRLDPSDSQVALEFAFLSYEARDQIYANKAKARRIFDRVRKTGDPASRATAEKAFQNIDMPLKAGIERWLDAIRQAPSNFTTHYELATLAEQRDELELAAEHYWKAWRILPERKSVLIDLCRVWKALNKTDEAIAAGLAASRGGEPRAAEAARELLPARYPYVNEFRRALEVDPNNVELRRELAYLLLRMKRQAEAEQEFRVIVDSTPGDLLSAAQLGFLRLARKDKASAMPLLDRVLQGNDPELANRVRAVLQVPQVAPQPVATEAKLMAERSIKAGYLKDALRYLKLAQELEPVDFSVMLRLGWTLNILHEDKQAISWFALARNSSDPNIAGEARKAYVNLRPDQARFRTTAWLFPLYSSRWRDTFAYGQIKTEMKLGNLPFRPYVSTRFIGDTRQRVGAALPEYLSESSIILAAGLATRYWHGMMVWGEAGSAVNYLTRRQDVGQTIRDYRGGVAFGRGFGHHLGGALPGWCWETTADGVFISRFQNDFLMYWQNRTGYSPRAIRSLGVLQTQFYWNTNLVRDTGRQYWANFVELGPGVRFRWAAMPRSLSFTVNYLRGSYTLNQGNPRGPNFFDLRAGVWYAFTR